MTIATNRIKYAFFLKGWVYENGVQSSLRNTAKHVLVSEYSADMDGHIFCPECCVGLFRSPKNQTFSKNGRAFFSHSRAYNPECGLRTKRVEGKRYETEEDARRAIDNKQLVILKGFMKDRPESPDGEAGEYDQTLVEDQNGGLADAPIGRHNSDEFQLPSKISTVYGICRGFDLNLIKYFFLPNAKYAIQLQDLLIDVRSVTQVSDTPQLYYGRISSSGLFQRSSIRKTSFEYESGPIQDFCLKLGDNKQAEKGIDGNSIGRVVLMYGAVTTNGTGLCISDLGWGEFAVLPEKYEHLLFDANA